MDSFRAESESQCDAEEFPNGLDKVEILVLTFDQGYEVRPVNDRSRAKEWMQDDVLKASVVTQEASIYKIVFRDPRTSEMTVYLQKLTKEAITDVLIPKIRSMLGPNGQVKHLNAKEVHDRITHDQSHRARMEARARAVGGDLEGVQNLLRMALQYAGPVNEDMPRSKRQRRMGSQVLDVIHTAQTAAASGLKMRKVQMQDEEP